MNTVNKKVPATAYITSFIAIILAIIMVLIFSGDKGATQEQVVASEPAFGSYNYNVMKIDTFTSLVNKAYGNLAAITSEEGRLYIDIKNANQVSRDFFNGNDSLLDYELGDFGFEIDYNQESQSLRATFNVTEQGGVHVPNDVLIKLMDKTHSN